MRLALAAVLILSPSVAAAQQSAAPQIASAPAPDQTDAPVAVVEDLHRALKSREASAALALMTADVVVLEEGCPTIARVGIVSAKVQASKELDRWPVPELEAQCCCSW